MNKEQMREKVMEEIKSASRRAVSRFYKHKIEGHDTEFLSFIVLVDELKTEGRL